MDNGKVRTAPRAFYPDYLQSTRPEPRTPGWDPGPERRLAGGHGVRRVLGWSGIGLAALGLGLPRGRAHAPRLVAALALLATMAALEFLQSRRLSWIEEYEFADERP